MFGYILFALYFLSSAALFGIFLRKLEEKHLWWIILASMVVFFVAALSEPAWDQSMDALCGIRH